MFTKRSNFISSGVFELTLFSLCRKAWNLCYCYALLEVWRFLFVLSRNLFRTFLFCSITYYPLRLSTCTAVVNKIENAYRNLRRLMGLNRSIILYCYYYNFNRVCWFINNYWGFIEIYVTSTGFYVISPRTCDIWVYFS